MSFVIAVPELVQGAAQDLAGIHASLAEATATVSAPTTGIAVAAQDEVSIAIASIFGSYGQQFQVLSTQAQAFHQEFVSLMNAGAGAYVSAEVANAEQVLLGEVGAPAQPLFGAGGNTTLGQIANGVGQAANGAVATLGGEATALSAAIAGAPVSLFGAMQTGAQAVSRAVTGSETQFGALATGGVPGLINDFNTFADQVAGPYKTLVYNTVTNLQIIGSTTMANPAPFLHQLVNNQIGYAQAIGTAIGTGLQNLPAELANLPAIQLAGLCRSA